MKYFVNDECIGCGMCNGLCPKVFLMNDAGMAEAIDQEVDPADEADAKEAMNSCPVGAIEEK